MKNNTPVKLKLFLGSLEPTKQVKPNENYWKLIGEKGRVIDCIENDNGRVLVLFEKNLDNFKLENHNPVKNSLWIKKSDLALDEYTLYLQQLEKEIFQRSSFMNNTKWFKIFTEITNHSIDTVNWKIKFLLSNNEINFRSIPNFNTKGFDDCSICPFLFKEIEWISINNQHEIDGQNSEKLKSDHFLTLRQFEKIRIILDGLGEFEYEITDYQLIIYGYR